MHFLEVVKQHVFQYNGIDWLVTITVFTGVVLLGDKKRLGFIIGMLSSAIGFLFSFQIGSVANGLSSIVLFVLYFRGFLKWTGID